MQKPTHGIVQRLGRRKRLMSALVRQHPYPCPEQTLNERVYTPQPEPHRRIRHSFGSHIVVEEVEGSRYAYHIPCYVGQATNAGPFEAMCRDRISDLLDCVVWDLEFVAIAVDQGATRL